MKRQSRHHASPLLLALALLLWTPVVTQAQQDSARLAGTVRSSINGLPLAGVMIAVGGTRVFDVSNGVGSFALAALPPGAQTLRILYGDSLTYEQQIKLKAGKTLTLSVLIPVDAVELTPIVVEARTLRAERSLAGFYERRRWAFGRFYTLADLERRHGLPVGTLLGESGVQLRCGLGYCLPINGTSPRPCVMSLFLDNMRLGGEDIELVRVDELAGVEVYKRGFDVPMEFRFGLGGDCGAVLMWRRY